MEAAPAPLDQPWKPGPAQPRRHPVAADLKYQHAPFRPHPMAGKPTRGGGGGGGGGGGAHRTTTRASQMQSQRGSAFQQRHQFEQTMAAVTSQMDDALMSEAARCQSLEDELKLLKEDLYLEKASNEDLKAELRELKRHNASLTQERSQTYKTINSMGSQKEFLQEDHQQLLHEIQVLRASEERLKRQVQRMGDENAKLRSYWEDGFSELKQRRIASITPEMLKDVARKGERAREQRREKMLIKENEHVTNLLAESQRVRELPLLFHLNSGRALPVGSDRVV